MQVQVDFILNLSNRYHEYTEYSNRLFDAINAIPNNIAQNIFEDYSDPDRKYQPVRLLRAEIARQMLDGSKIDKKLVEDIKNRIRKKETSSFNFLTAEFLEQFSNSTVGKRDIFANWQKNWNVFHTFL